MQALPFAPPDVDHVRNLLEEGLSKHVVLVADDEGTLKGTIIGVYIQHPLNPSITVLQEVAWWVPEEHRRGRAGWILLQAFAALERTNITTLSLLPNSAVAAKHLNKLGFEAAETAFVKENRY